MGTHPIFESDFDCLTAREMARNVCVTPGNPYHMSRHEIVDWVNDTLSCDIKTIGDLGQGSHYCQLMDMMFPGTINMRKVKWNCRHETEKMSNFKLLQEVFKRLSIDKTVPINNMVKGNMKSNLEFMQWFVLLFDANYEVHEYDPVKERKKCQTPGPAGRPRSRRSLRLTNSSTKKELKIVKPVNLDQSPRSSTMSSHSGPTVGSLARTKSPYQRRMQRSLAEQQIQGELDGLKGELSHFRTLLQSVEEQRQYELKKLLTVEEFCDAILKEDDTQEVAKTVNH